MKKLLLAFVLLTNIAFAQTDDSFLNEFLLEDNLKPSNEVAKYRRYDFSNIWTQTEDRLIYGIIGTDHQRIRMKLISIKRQSSSLDEYVVFGKSNVKETICDFHGSIKIKEIREVKNLNFGVDDEYKTKGIKAQGVLIATYTFEEDKEQNHSGVFKGHLYSRWYLDAIDQIRYDDIQSMSDEYLNNAFIGTWKSYKTGTEKICNWGDRRVPKANQDFDIGAGEFSVSEKYWNKGWEDFAWENQVRQDSLQRMGKISGAKKEWWK